MKTRIFFFCKTLFFVLTLVFLLPVTESTVQAEEDFFSYQRFFLDDDVLAQIPADGRAKTQIRDFSVYYTEGLYHFSAGHYEDSKRFLKRARRTWPEFYAADFLIAMVYEMQDEPSIAARYYKSYLTKLRHLNRGHYRISAPAIRAITRGGTESYAHARRRVKNRLEGYGIQLEDVRPARASPVFFQRVLLLLFFLGIVVFITHKIFPLYRKKKQVREAPEGFWVCPRCLETNPDLRKECAKCSYVREENGGR